ncbi:hypothetical protein KL948_001147 [Ogataea haglerorum]|nr:hypothetical protein KL948_001147 [Ogataea haglerorum]
MLRKRTDSEESGTRCTGVLSRTQKFAGPANLSNAGKRGDPGAKCRFAVRGERNCGEAGTRGNSGVAGDAGAGRQGRAAGPCRGPAQWGRARGRVFVRSAYGEAHHGCASGGGHVDLSTGAAR